MCASFKSHSSLYFTQNIYLSVSSVDFILHENVCLDYVISNYFPESRKVTHTPEANAQSMDKKCYKGSRFNCVKFFILGLVWWLSRQRCLSSQVTRALLLIHGGRKGLTLSSCNLLPKTLWRVCTNRRTDTHTHINFKSFSFLYPMV